MAVGGRWGVSLSIFRAIQNAAVVLHVISPFDCKGFAKSRLRGREHHPALPVGKLFGLKKTVDQCGMTNEVGLGNDGGPTLAPGSLRIGRKATGVAQQAVNVLTVGNLLRQGRYRRLDRRSVGGIEWHKDEIDLVVSTATCRLQCRDGLVGAALSSAE